MSQRRRNRTVQPRGITLIWSWEYETTIYVNTCSTCALRPWWRQHGSASAAQRSTTRVVEKEHLHQAYGATMENVLELGESPTVGRLGLKRRQSTAGRREVVIYTTLLFFPPLTDSASVPQSVCLACNQLIIPVPLWTQAALWGAAKFWRWGGGEVRGQLQAGRSKPERRLGVHGVMTVPQISTASVDFKRIEMLRVIRRGLITNVNQVERLVWCVSLCASVCLDNKFPAKLLWIYTPGTLVHLDPIYG